MNNNNNRINQIIELENILNQELEAYSKLEEYLGDKKKCLIKGEIEKIQAADEELEKYNLAVQKLEAKRKQIYPENLTLREIIDNIENREQAERITLLRTKIKSTAENAKKQNNISIELLRYSMKLAENSISTITNALIPQGAAYSRMGAVKPSKQLEELSSVNHEV